MSKERHDIGEQEDVDTSIVDAAAIRLNGETIYLAAAYMHIAECYLAKGQLELAARNYRKSLRLFAMVTLLRPPFYGQAVSEYVRVLNALGKQVEASKMQSEYDKTGRVTFIPK